jgi:hypothetical protein
MATTSINSSGTLYVTGLLDEVSIGTGSIQFDGSTQYLTIPSNNIFAYGTADFTVECWVFKISSADGSVLDMYAGASVAGTFGFYITSTTIVASQTNSQAFTFTYTLALDTWNHIAFSRYGGNLYCFVNGISVGSQACTNNFVSVAVLTIGRNPGGNNQYYTGYISNLRIVKGVALYKGNFTPPTGPLSTVLNTVLLLNKNVITDSSVYNSTVTNVGSVIGSSFVPFYIDNSLGSIKLNGTTPQYVTYPVGTTNLAIAASQPFTVEFYIYTITQVQTAPAVFSTTNNGGNSGHMAFFVGHSGLGIANQYGLYWFGMGAGTGGAGTGANLLSSTINYVKNVWVHIAIVRAGAGAVTMYINGISNATVTYTGAVSFTNGVLYFGTSGDSLTGSDYTGYISNFRWIKGTAIYNSNFTPPKQPLINAYGTQTSILLSTSAVTTSTVIADSGFSNFTPTPIGSPTSAVLNPFVNANLPTVTNTVQRLVGPQGFNPGLQTLGEIDEITLAQGSLQFNGSTAVLTSAAANSVNFGTSNFTVEFWIYIPAYVTSDSNEKDIIEGNPSGGSFQIYIAGSAQGFRWGRNGVLGNLILAAASIPVGRWFHVAVSRAGTGASQTFAFINGLLVLAATDSNNYSVAGLGIGGRNTGANYFAGYISNLRCVNGTALYTQNFTPSTRPLEQVPNTSLLLTTPYTSQYITDFSTSSVVLTKVGGVASTGLSPFATIGSLYFTNTTGLAFPANNAFAFAGDFTIEGWMYFTSTSGSPQSLIGMPSLPNWFDIRWYNGNWEISLNGAGGTSLGSTPTPVANNWYHVAVVRSGSYIRAYINGVATPNTLVNSSTLGYNNVALGVGGDGTGSNLLTNGYISNLRIVNGVAVYSTNTNFTPPTQPLTAFGTQTSLLLSTPNSLNLYKDFSQNNFTASIAVSTSTIFNPFVSSLSNPPSRTGTVQRVNSNGLQVGGYFDEFSTNRGSVSFNGTSQYLSASAVPSILGNAFTVESYIYVTDTAFRNFVSYGNGSGQFRIFIQDSNTQITVWNGASIILTATYSGSILNKWAHVAVTRDAASTVAVWLNGVSVGTLAGYSTAWAAGSLWIGADPQSTTYDFSGYMSNFRLIIGTAIYTAAFARPRAPLTLDYYSTQTSLLLNTVALPALNLQDSSLNNYTVTPVGSPPPSELNPF